MVNLQIYLHYELHICTTVNLQIYLHYSLTADLFTLQSNCRSICTTVKLLYNLHATEFTAWRKTGKHDTRFILSVLYIQATLCN